MISLCAAAQMEVPAGLWLAVLGSWKPPAVLPFLPAPVNQVIITLQYITSQHYLTVLPQQQSSFCHEASDDIYVVVVCTGTYLKWYILQDTSVHSTMKKLH